MYVTWNEVNLFLETFIECCGLTILLGVLYEFISRLKDSSEFNPHIVFLGNIGSGKTTIGRKVSELLKLPFYKENIKNNPFLEIFYTNQKKWAFELQMQCLVHGLEEHKYIINSKKGGVQDYFSVYANHPFIETLKENGKLIKIQENLYENWFKMVANSKILKCPHIVVYIEETVEKCLKRIIERIKKDPTRKMEKGITKEYLQILGKNIKIGYQKFKKDHKNYKILFCEIKNEYTPNIVAKGIIKEIRSSGIFNSVK